MFRSRSLTAWYVLLIFVTVFTAGCGTSKLDSQKPNTWAVNYISHETTTRIQAYYSGSGYYYFPDDGYQWLVVKLAVHNSAKEDKCLNWFMDDISYVAANGNKHSQKLAYSSPVGQLPSCFNPGQTQTGDVYFEVPISMSPSGGKVVFTPYQEGSITITLP